MLNHDFEWVRGDDETETLIFTDENGNPLDFTNCRFDLHIQPKTGEKMKLSSQAQDILINENQVQLIIAHRHTQNANWKQAQYDLQCTYPNGRVQTLVGGSIVLIPDVTQ